MDPDVAQAYAASTAISSKFSSLFGYSILTKNFILLQPVKTLVLTCSRQVQRGAELMHRSLLKRRRRLSKRWLYRKGQQLPNDWSKRHKTTVMQLLFSLTSSRKGQLFKTSIEISLFLLPQRLNLQLNVLNVLVLKYINMTMQHYFLIKIYLY